MAAFQRPYWRDPRLRAAACLAVLTIAAAWLRLRGLDSLLPHVVTRDGINVVVPAELRRAGTPEPWRDPNWNMYPHLLAGIVSLLPSTSAEGARRLDEHLAAASAIWLQVRGVSAWIGVLAVPATYALARHFLDRGRSLIAAGLVATSLLHVLFSPNERPHATLTTAALLAVLASLRLRRRPDARGYAVAGAASAAALGALHSGVLALGAVAAGWWNRRRARGIPAWLGIVIVLLVLCAGAWWFYPFAFEGPPKARIHEGTVSLWGQPLFLDRFRGRGFATLASTLWYYDPVLFTLALAGLLRWTIGAARAPVQALGTVRGDLGVVLGFAAPYALVFGAYSDTAGRYTLPLVPFLACAAAWVLPARRPAASALLLVLPLVPAWRLAELRRVPDTLEEAARTFVERAAPGERIAVVPGQDLPLFTEERALADNNRYPWHTIWARYQSGLDPGRVEGERYGVLVNPMRGRVDPMLAGDALLERLRELDIQWVLMGTLPGPPIQNELLRALREAGRDGARLSPLRIDDGSQAWGPDFLAGPAFACWPLGFQVVRLRTLGPTLELYRIP